MWEDSVRTLHSRERLDDFLSQFNFLTASQIVLHLKVNIESTACDRPAEATKNLVEGWNVEAGAEISTGHEDVTDLLETLLGLIIVVYLKHCSFDTNLSLYLI